MEEQQIDRQKDSWGQLWIGIGAVLIIWIVPFVQRMNWLTAQYAARSGRDVSIWPSIWPVLAAFVGMFALGRYLANRPNRLPRYAAVLDTWSHAAWLMLLMLPIRFFPPLGLGDLTPWQHAVQLVALLVLIVILYLTMESRDLLRRPAVKAGWLPWFVAPIIMFDWFLGGVFGSVLETVVSIAIGLLFGYAVGLLVGHFLLPAISADSRGDNWDFWLTGWAVGGTLAMMGSALGVEAQFIFLAQLLPFVGLVGVGLMQGERSTASPHPILGRLVGIVTAIVLISADVDELTVLFLDSNEIFIHLLTSVEISTAMAVVLALFLWLLRNRVRRPLNNRVLKVLTVVAWLGMGGILVTKPNRGFHGDQLFVIMESQADLSAATEIENVEARREFVYETLVTHADTSQADVRAVLDLFGAQYQPYYLVNAIAVRGGLPMRMLLSRFDEVDRVIADPMLRPLDVSSVALSNQGVDFQAEPPPEDLPWGLVSIGADRVWHDFGVRGAGVVIGQSDSGVQWDHPELVDSYRGGDGSHEYNWFDAWESSPFPYDASGHGTHTLGSIVGHNVGVAPDAIWFGCANLVRNYASPSLYLDCMQFMLAPYPFGGDPLVDGDASFSADILNNSWGCPPFEGCDPTALQAGVEALRAAGIFVVASAGNEGASGCGSVSSPLALYDASFSVGAFDESGALAPFSSLGPVTVDGSQRIKPDLIAPGIDINSALPGSGYGSNSGTSMAGPHVAGAVALIWSANPALRGNINATELILIETATPFDSAEHDTPACDNLNNAVGYGYLNAYDAVKRALEWR